MTIRLRCAECRRKLKVVDEALGKKVQCPACGARFIGKIESSSPPAVKSQPHTPSAAVPLATPVSPPPPEIPADNDIFSELSAFSTPSVEEAPPVQETPEAKPAAALFPDLELDEPPAEVRDPEVEAVDPEVIDEGVEPLPVEDETGLEEIEEVVADEDLPELPEEEVIEEGFEEEPWAPPPAQKGKKSSPSDIEDAEEDEEETPKRRGAAGKQKKSGKGMVLLLVGGLCVLLLGCGGVGFMVYRWFSDENTPATSKVAKAPFPKPSPVGPRPGLPGNLVPGSPANNSWKTFAPPNGHFTVLLPGDPADARKQGDPGIAFRLTRQPAGETFEVGSLDLPPGQDPTEALNAKAASTEKFMLDPSSSKKGAALRKRDIPQAGALCKELAFQRSGSGLNASEVYVVRYYVSLGQTKRFYQTAVWGKDVKLDQGDAFKFLDSFKITD